MSEEGRLTALRDLGLVAQVFDERSLSGLHGDLAIGHTRYSTTGGDGWENAQPLLHHGRVRTVALGHNGNLVNAEALREHRRQAHRLELRLGGDRGADRRRRAAARARRFRRRWRSSTGAATVVGLADGRLFAFRDAHGFRPLVLGRLGDDPVVASETCALAPRRREVEREIRPGELVIADDDGVHTIQALEPAERGALCIFEFFYLARPDTRLSGVEVHGARVRMGERLAAEAPADADLVLPIPDSGTPAAIGFARATGIPFSEGLIKNRYVGRTFIQPEQGMREQGIRMKFNPLAEVAGKRRRRRRRLDRARLDDAADRRDALRRRRRRGARAHLVAARRLALLLRNRPRIRGRDDRGARDGRGGARRDRRDEPRATSRSKACRRRRDGPRTPSAARA